MKTGKVAENEAKLQEFGILTEFGKKKRIKTQKAEKRCAVGAQKRLSAEKRGLKKQYFPQIKLKNAQKRSLMKKCGTKVLLTVCGKLWIMINVLNICELQTI